MSIRFEQYRIFVAVAQAGSFSKAAQSLYMTQPAISQTIRNIEDGLAIKLFDRLGKGVRLTKEGELLYEWCLPAVKNLQSIPSRVKKLKQLESGEIRIGVSDTVTRYLLPTVLSHYTKTYPSIQIQLVNATGPELLVFLEEGAIDLAIGGIPEKTEDLQVYFLMDLHDIFVIHKKDWMIEMEKYTMTKLLKHKLILLDQKSGARLKLDHFFSTYQIHLLADIELSSHDLLVSFAKQRLGVACVVKEFYQLHNDAAFLKEIQLEEIIPARKVGYFYKKGHHPSYATHAFMDLLYQVTIH